MPQEWDAWRKNHDAVGQVQRQGGEIKRLEQDLGEQEADPWAEVEQYLIAGYDGKSQSLLAEAEERFNRAQVMANKRICGLEKLVDAQNLSISQLQADLNEARRTIAGLLSTHRLDNRELQMYRASEAHSQSRAMQYHPQQGLTSITLPPLETYAPPPEMNVYPPLQLPGGMLLPQPQLPFRTRNPGFSPDRNSGFIGNAPSPGSETGMKSDEKAGRGKM